MTLDILGMNGPFPEPEGATSGYLLCSGDTRIAMDMGCGTLSRLTGLMAPETLDAVFLSHFHYDHTSDILPLLYRLQATGKTLHVYAPQDEGSPIRAILEKDPGAQLHTLEPGSTVQVGGIVIRAFRAVHPVPALMFRAEAEGKVFAFTGDTNRNPELPALAHGADLLLADGLFSDATWGEGKPHLSARMCAELARDEGVGQLVITHLSPMLDRETLLREAREAFPDVRLAACGMRCVI